MTFLKASVRLPFVVAMLWACTPDPNLPTAEMKRAQQAIEQAEKAGARRYALPVLKQAHAAYELAEDAHRRGNEAVTRFRAAEAATLAARAATLASSGETQRAAAEVRKSMDTAKDAMDRSAPQQ